MSTDTDAAAGADPVVTERQIASAVIASCLGWSLDLFDLFILLYVAPVLGHAFFPSDRPTLSLSAVYASFAVTLLMRPVGSAVFGSYADVHGRKRAMTIAVVGVGIVTALLGALPTIQQAGVIAPVLFLLMRLVQGVFVGGVVASTHTIGTETVPPRWRGFMSGLVGGGGGGIGALLASGVFLIASVLFPGALFAAWGWRFMFFCGLASSVLGFFIFRNLEESPIWQQMDAKRGARRNAGAAAEPGAITRSPLRTLFAAEHRPILLVNLLMTFGGGAGYYLTSGYMPTMLKVVVRQPNGTASVILIVSSLCAIAASLLVGTLSDFTGRRAMFRIMGVTNLILLPLLYLWMPGAQDTQTVALYAIVICFLGNAAYAPLLIFLNERFPTAIRASGTGLSWNIGFALGGTMPTFVSLASGSPAGIPVALAVFLGVIFALFVFATFVIPETRGRLA
jgi:MFS family permease